MFTHTASHRSLGIAGFVATVCAAAALAAPAAAAPADQHGSLHQQGYSWSPRPTGVQEQFRGLAPVSSRVAWVSGEKGSVLRTTDGGKHWTDVSPAAAKADGLALRDIEAWDSEHAEALSIGPGSDSRIFRTDDGGQTWQQVFTNTDPAAFYDCMAFSSKGIGLAMSDPVDGYFRIARTTDSGKSWTALPTTGMPKALGNEFGFAASGTCLVSAQDAHGARPGEFWFATGGESPRVFHTTNAGDSWTVEDTTVRAGDAAGIYSIAFKNHGTGVAVGGDYTAPTDGTDAAATKHGSSPWKASSNALGGYRSGVAYVPGWGNAVIAVGPTGSDVSSDGGRTWSTFDTTDYDGIHCASDGACWASGPDGAVAQLVIHHGSAE
ncbi:MAG TPA: YCF48-related protein [Flexivirga sp.]|uniref:WD40/YVTN/BNR-like repeat-containing protein n=1 Tax=Flexivirga sp. TaxID=1962927 RepID=UPI002B84F03E|nr:YCF48-related protein [Flexivirga sp.]HWC21070.1 YCF48-related protein [Flexivirga sp.]